MAFLNRFQDYLMKYILHNKLIRYHGLFSHGFWRRPFKGSPCCLLCWDGNADSKAHPLEINISFHPETNKIQGVFFTGPAQEVLSMELIPPNKEIDWFRHKSSKYETGPTQEKNDWFCPTY